MNRRICCVKCGPAAAMALGLTIFPAIGIAQVSVGASVSLATPYVWRGLTRSNGWNVQPEAFLAVGISHGILTAGGWANLEAGADSPGNLSDLGSDRLFRCQQSHLVENRFTAGGGAPRRIDRQDDALDGR